MSARLVGVTAFAVIVGSTCFVFVDQVVGPGMTTLQFGAAGLAVIVGSFCLLTGFMAVGVLVEETWDVPVLEKVGEHSWKIVPLFFGWAALEADNAGMFWLVVAVTVLYLMEKKRVEEREKRVQRMLGEDGWEAPSDEPHAPDD